MNHPTFNPRRRAWLAKAAEVAGCAAATAVVGGSLQAGTKADKSEVMYQDHRHDGKSCGLCKFFMADDRDASVGICAVVEGAISRDGWCAAFSPSRVA